MNAPGSPMWRTGVHLRRAHLQLRVASLTSAFGPDHRVTRVARARILACTEALGEPTAGQIYQLSAMYLVIAYRRERDDLGLPLPKYWGEPRHNRHDAKRRMKQYAEFGHPGWVEERCYGAGGPVASRGTRGD